MFIHVKLFKFTISPNFVKEKRGDIKQKLVERNLIISKFEKNNRMYIQVCKWKLIQKTKWNIVSYLYF